MLTWMLCHHHQEAAPFDKVLKKEASSLNRGWQWFPLADPKGALGTVYPVGVFPSLGPYFSISCSFWGKNTKIIGWSTQSWDFLPFLSGKSGSATGSCQLHTKGHLNERTITGPSYLLSRGPRWSLCNMHFSRDWDRLGFYVDKEWMLRNNHRGPSVNKYDAVSWSSTSVLGLVSNLRWEIMPEVKASKQVQRLVPTIHGP